MRIFGYLKNYWSIGFFHEISKGRGKLGPFHPPFLGKHGLFVWEDEGFPFVKNLTVSWDSPKATFTPKK